MPKSPGSLTPASFLKKPPDPTPFKKKRGNKRKLSTSPTLPPVSKPRISTTPPDKTGSNSPTSPVISPLLPYQLRPKKSSSISKSTKFSLSSSLLSHSMDNILESGHDDIVMELPSADEVDALLHEDSTESKEDDADAGSFSPLSNADSPTAAVKAAIEAKMNENLITLDTSSKAVIDANKNDSKNDSNQAVPLPSLPPPLPKPRPLFPNGIPPFAKPATCPSQGSSIGTGQDKAASNNPTKQTYASKARSPSNKEIVENILHIYSSQSSKNPLTYDEWKAIDAHILYAIANQDLDDPFTVRIASSGYDAPHKCGYIACRDLASENWCKALLGLNGAGCFRAWSKGEQPIVRLCRLFFPSRFDSLSEDKLILLLKRHNPPLQQGTITLKNSVTVQGGRALFLELDTNLYAYVKSKKHKVEFPMMDIDCQLYVPPVGPSSRPPSSRPSLPGITRIVRPPPPLLPTSGSVQTTLASTSSRDPRRSKEEAGSDAQSGVKTPTEDGPSQIGLDKPGAALSSQQDVTKKRERSQPRQVFQDASKKRQTNSNSDSKSQPISNARRAKQ